MLHQSGAPFANVRSFPKEQSYRAGVFFSPLPLAPPPSYPASSFPLASGRETATSRHVKPACAVRDEDSKYEIASPLSLFRPRTYYFYSPQSSTVIKSKMAANTNKVSPTQNITQNTPALPTSFPGFSPTRPYGARDRERDSKN